MSPLRENIDTVAVAVAVVVVVADEFLVILIQTRGSSAALYMNTDRSKMKNKFFLPSAYDYILLRAGALRSSVSNIDSLAQSC